MLTDDSTVENIKFLTQSPVRVQILELLREEGALSKNDLAEHFDVSRVTIQRNVKALEERDWIDNSHPTYAITPLGELVIEEVTPLTDSMEIARKLRPFLKWMPRDSFDVDPLELADATVIPVDPTDPYNWVSYHIERFESVSHVRMTLPMIGDEAWDVTTKRTLAGELEAEFIADPDVAETLRTNPRYTEKVEQVLATDRLTLSVYDGQFSYGIGLFDQYVQMIAMDDDGLPQTLVETDSETVHGWAETKFESYRAKAEPVEF